MSSTTESRFASSLSSYRLFHQCFLFELFSYLSPTDQLLPFLSPNHRDFNLFISYLQLVTEQLYLDNDLSGIYYIDPLVTEQLFLNNDLSRIYYLDPIVTEQLFPDNGLSGTYYINPDIIQVTLSELRDFADTIVFESPPEEGSDQEDLMRLANRNSVREHDWAELYQSDRQLANNFTSSTSNNSSTSVPLTIAFDPAAESEVLDILDPEPALDLETEEENVTSVYEIISDREGELAEEGDDVCCICKEFKPKEKGFENCEHMFCVPCLRRWKMATDFARCPLCRSG